MSRNNDAKMPVKRHNDAAAGEVRRNTSPKVCPVCGQYTFTEPHEICPMCGWEQDSVQEKNPYFEGGANEMCLLDAKKKWEEERRR